MEVPANRQFDLTNYQRLPSRINVTIDAITAEPAVRGMPAASQKKRKIVLRIAILNGRAVRKTRLHQRCLLIFALTLVAALGCGLIAGVFFAFSAFVMKSLAGLSPSEGIAAMQAINRVILRSTFMAVFLGTTLLSVVALVCSFLQWREPGAAWLLAGGALYLAGSFLVTIVFNVPLNVALETAKPADAASAAHWTAYLEKWTAWNHVRTMASLAAAASFSMALVS